MKIVPDMTPKNMLKSAPFLAALALFLGGLPAHAAAPPAKAQESAPVLTKAAVPPVIDGVLDDPAWAAGLKYDGFKTFKPDYGKDASQKTEAFMEEVFAVSPVYRRTKRGHYAPFGPTRAGRLVVVVFEMKEKGLARVITGWDMNNAERRYCQKHQGR